MRSNNKKKLLKVPLMVETNGHRTVTGQKFKFDWTIREIMEMANTKTISGRVITNFTIQQEHADRYCMDN